MKSAVTAAAQWIHDPPNLFMNVPITTVEDGKGGEVSLPAPTCPRGGYVVLRAEVEYVWWS